MGLLVLWYFCLVFNEPWSGSPLWISWLSFPPTGRRVLFPSYPLQHLLLFSDADHSDLVRSHCTTHPQFSNTYRCWAFFHVLHRLLCLLWRNVHLNLVPLFDCVVSLILRCISCLCVLEINSLWVSLFANISFVMRFVFLFMVFSSVTTPLRVIRSHLFIFVLIFVILRGGSKKDLLHFMSKCVLLFS